jgi:hypothetical protein
MKALEWANAQVSLDPSIDEAARLKFVERLKGSIISFTSDERDG